MLIYSLPTPFYLDRLIDHKLMEETICSGLKKVESCGVTFIAMLCNTAHLYFDALQASINVSLMDMVNITLDALPPSAKNIAILDTRPTNRFPDFLETFNSKRIETNLTPALANKSRWDDHKSQSNE